MNRKAIFVACLFIIILNIPVMANSTVATLEQVAPIPTTYGLVSDFYPFQYTAIGDVTASLVDGVGLGGAADFVGFPAGAIALIERGTHTFALKVENAAGAGAVGVIIYDSTFQNDAILGTLSSLSSIPALFVTRDIGLGLLSQSQAAGVTIHMVTYTSDPPPISQVPEPLTFLILGSGFASVGLLRRKFRN